MISISYGVCEASVKPYTRRAHAVRPPAGRDRRAGNHDRRRGRRQRLVVVRARRADLPADELRQAEVGVLAGDLAVGARRRRHQPHAHPGEHDRVLGRLERHRVPAAVPADRRGRRRRQHLREPALVAAGDPRRRRPTGWSPTSPRSPTRAPATRSSARTRVQGCGPSPGQTIAFVGGTSAATPLVAGMIALWDQQAKQIGPAQARVRPAAALLDRPPRARLVPRHHHRQQLGLQRRLVLQRRPPGFDLASGLGSPLADQIAKQLHH